MALPCGPASAQSEEPEGPSEAAREHAAMQLEQAQEALDKGNLKRARALMRASNELAPAATTLLRLAECEEKLNLLASAWQHYQDALALLKPTERASFTAKEKVEALAPLVPKLRLDPPAKPIEGLRILLDSIELPKEILGGEMPLDPGRYSVMVIVPGHEENVYRVKLDAGKSEAIKLEPGAKLPPPPPPKPTVTAKPPPPKRTLQVSDEALRGIGAAVSAIGIIGLGAGLVTTGIVLNVNAGPLDTEIAVKGTGEADTGPVAGAIAGVVGGSLVTWLGVGLFVAGSPDLAAQLRVGASPNGGKLTLTGSF